MINGMKLLKSKPIQGCRRRSRIQTAFHSRLLVNSRTAIVQTLAILGLTIVTATSVAAEDTYFQKGFNLQKQGQYELAAAMYTTWLGSHGNDQIAYNNRGLSYYELGQFDKAIADYDKAIALTPDGTAAYNNRGSSYHELGQFDKAIADYDKAIALKPDYSDAYNNRGLSYRKLGQFNKAIADYDKAIALKPDDPKSYFNRGNSYKSLDQLDKAIADYSKAITLKPDYQTAYYTRGLSYKSLGQFDKATTDFDRAIALKPEDKFAYYHRGEALVRQKKMTESLQDFERAFPGNDENSFFYSSRAVANFVGGDKAKGIADIEKALALAGTNAEAKKEAERIKNEFMAQTSNIATTSPKTTQTENNAAKPGTSLGVSTNKERPIADKWALVVGISQFKNSKYDLKFAAKDATDFYNYLVTEGNFEKDHVLLLLNQNATKDNIMTAFGDKFLPAVAQPDDLVVVFVSTHGTPKNKDQGKRNYIVAHDTDINRLYATGVNMDELYARVKEAVNTDRALIVMDTCYSGGGVPGAKAMADSANFDANEIAQGCGHLVITSSAPNERSWESTVSPNGVFTKYLLQALRKNNGDLKNAFTDLQTKVSWEVKSAFNATQSPQLGGNWEGKDLLLSVPARQPRQLFNKELLDMMHQSAQGSANFTKPATSPIRSSPPGKK